MIVIVPAVAMVVIVSAVTVVVVVSAVAMVVVVPAVAMVVVFGHYWSRGFLLIAATANPRSIARSFLEGKVSKRRTVCVPVRA